MMEGFAQRLNQRWDLEKVREVVSGFSDIAPQPEVQQHAWKSSWFWNGKTDDEIEELREALKRVGLAAQVVYSTARDLDVLPLAANKGNAVTWLANYLGVGMKEVLVAGDSGNDASMFLLNGVRGIVPKNASPELVAEIEGLDSVYIAGKTCASGVVEGLRFHAVF